MKTIAIVIFLMFAIAGQSYAFDLSISIPKGFDVEAQYRIWLPNNKTVETSMTGLEARVGWKPVFAWFSYDEANRRMYGQTLKKFSLYGLGGGARVNIGEYLQVHTSIGYFIPKSDLQSNPGMGAEPLGYYWKELLTRIGQSQFCPRIYKFGYQIQGNVGGSIGLDFKYPLYKGLNLNVTADYRWLRLRETFKGYISESSYVETRETNSFSGPLFGVGLKYEF